MRQVLLDSSIQFEYSSPFDNLLPKPQNLTSSLHFPPQRPRQISKPPPVKITQNLTGLKTDDQFFHFIQSNKHKATTTTQTKTIVNFSSSFCHICHKLFPAFISLSKSYPQHQFAIAQVDNMDKAIRGINYTPTIAVYSSSKGKVDEFLGADGQRLRDHLWLWTD